MESRHLEALEALELQQAPDSDHQAPTLLDPAMASAIAEIEWDYGCTIVDPQTGRLNPAGLRLLVWARTFYARSSLLRDEVSTSRRDGATRSLVERQSISPKRLGHPGPDPADLRRIIDCALHSPDHGGLHPWRVIEFMADQREALADLFEAEKRRRDPMAPLEDLQRAREHATRPPMLLAFIVSPKSRKGVPVREQHLAAGAALGNLLNATHMLGFGGIVLSGERCYDTALLDHLGVTGDEFLAGFVSLGKVVTVPKPRAHASPEDVLSAWAPALQPKVKA